MGFGDEILFSPLLRLPIVVTWPNVDILKRRETPPLPPVIKQILVWTLDSSKILKSFTSDKMKTARIFPQDEKEMGFISLFFHW